MSNINGSLIRISEIMRNSIISFDVTANVRESVARMNEQFRNIVKVYESTALLRNQKIVVIGNVMPRIKPDCSSRVMGNLNVGQVVTISEKYKKWVKIDWEDEDGNLCSGWIQNYKLTKFR